MAVRLPAIEPRHYQMAFWQAMDRGCRRAVKSWHWRAGKDICDFSYMVREAVRRPGTYYYYFPTLELAKKALWDNMVEIYKFGECIAAGNLVDIICPPAVRKRRNNSDYFLELCNGSFIKIGGTDKLDVVGMNGMGYVFSEWQSQKKEAFGYISPILRENDGWALFNGTMRGKRNHLYMDVERNQHYPSWFSQWLKPEDTLEYWWVNEAEGINCNAQLEGKLHPHTLRPYVNIQELVDSGEISMWLARQEYLNDAVSVIGGSYYSYEMSEVHRTGRVNAKHDPNSVVYTFWDLGGVTADSDRTAVVFAQMLGCDGPVQVIDYYEGVGKVRSHYLEYIASKGYRYGGHFLPHDAKRRNEDTGENWIETARLKHGIEMRAVPKANYTVDDIEITRRDLRNYSFHPDKCHDLMEHLGNYHESQATGKPCHKNNCILCRGASHGADALRMMAVARKFGMVEAYLDKPQAEYWWKGRERDINLDAEMIA